jgi:hypothetical protein
LLSSINSKESDKEKQLTNQRDRRTLQEWMKDPEFKDKVKAMNLSSEIAAAVLQLSEGIPNFLAARHEFPRTSLTAKIGVPEWIYYPDF